KLGQLNREPSAPDAINHGGQVVGFANGSGGQQSAWIWTGSGSIKDLNSLIPKNSGWTLQDARGLNDAGQIVVDGQKRGSSVGACLLTPTSAPAAAVTTTSSRTDAKTASLAPVQVAAQSPLPPTVAPTSAPGPQDSPILIPLTSMTDQDLTLLATELIRS